MSERYEDQSFTSKNVELARREVVRIADEAQLLSIKNKRLNGWALLPEDETFLLEYEQRQIQARELAAREKEAVALESQRITRELLGANHEREGIRSAILYLKRKPKIEALASAYKELFNQRLSLAQAEKDPLIVSMIKKFTVPSVHDEHYIDMWAIKLARGDCVIDYLYPEEEVRRAEQVMIDNPSIEAEISEEYD